MTVGKVVAICALALVPAMILSGIVGAQTYATLASWVIK